jgi:thiamine monophosphate kinase
MRESEFIKLFASIHGTAPYAADAEIVGRGNGFELFSTDSFSETDDFFTRTPPETIGRNLAAGACADLLACGVRPELLLQSWNIDGSKGEGYYRSIAEGIEKVLQHYGAKCIGGDIGTALPWCWTATVAAHSAVPPVTRIARERVPFDLYISGGMGRANLAMFRNDPMPEIPLRGPVPPEALFATDTSGGFFDALENIRRVNRGMVLEFESGDAVSPEVFEKLPEGFDPLWSLIGGVGEYELLFAMPRGTRADGVKIGEGGFRDGTGNDFRFKPGGCMKSAPPDYRNTPPEDRLAVTRTYLQELLRP